MPMFSKLAIPYLPNNPPRWPEVTDAVKKLVEIYAKNAETQSNAGYLLFEAGRVAEARPHLDAAVRLAPTDPQVWLNRGALRMSVGDAAGAESDYSRTIALQPDVVPAWQGRAVARYAQGNVAGCLADLDEAAKRAPEGS